MPYFPPLMYTSDMKPPLPFSVKRPICVVSELVLA
jgi:hypothetical protein